MNQSVFLRLPRALGFAVVFLGLILIGLARWAPLAGHSSVSPASQNHALVAPCHFGPVGCVVSGIGSALTTYTPCPPSTTPCYPSGIGTPLTTDLPLGVGYAVGKFANAVSPPPLAASVGNFVRGVDPPQSQP